MTCQCGNSATVVVLDLSPLMQRLAEMEGNLMGRFEDLDAAVGGLQAKVQSVRDDLLRAIDEIGAGRVESATAALTAAADSLGEVDAAFDAVSPDPAVATTEPAPADGSTAEAPADGSAPVDGSAPAEATPVDGEGATA